MGRGLECRWVDRDWGGQNGQVVAGGWWVGVALGGKWISYASNTFLDEPDTGGY